MASVCSHHRVMLFHTLREIRSFAPKDRGVTGRCCGARRRILVPQRPGRPSPPPPDVDCDPCPETEKEESRERNPRAETPAGPKPSTGSQERACADAHMTEIITTVLHSGGAGGEKNYDLKQLFEQHLVSGKRCPRTLAQKGGGQEVLRDISRPRNQPAARRRSSRIKRDLARLAAPGRGARKRNPAKSLQRERETRAGHKHSQDRPGKGGTNSSEAQAETSKRCAPCVTRLRRNIVRPHRFTSYVTEPKKMFYAAQVFDATEKLNGKTDQPAPKQNKRKACQAEGDVRPRPKRAGTARAADQTQPDRPVTEPPTDTARYASPIKLMLFSSVEGEHGVKYTLRAAQTNPDERAFDPCVEASWAGDAGRESGAADDDHVPVLKRRVGRRKKVNAQPDEVVKRPRAEPGAGEASGEEDAIKPLQIALRYGRRRARRGVSDHLKSEQPEGGGKRELSLGTPLEDGKRHSDVRGPKQTGGAGRKPGRPAEVKTSGIPLAVTARSQQRRKIPVGRETPSSKAEPSREEQTVVSGRHSSRERRPSIHLQNCVGGASLRPHKPAPNKSDRPLELDESAEVKDGRVLPNESGRAQDAARFSEWSTDSIFAWDASLEWWAASASADALEKELDRRIGVMTETWVSEPDDSASSSSVKTLFGRKGDKETLSSWFMQTTETQSLAIVKKVSTRNTAEVFHYSSSRRRGKARACSSPQAERLRKHLKKFARVVPKSPAKLRGAQEKIRNVCKRLVKRPLFRNQKMSPGRAWLLYRASLKRAKTQLKIRTGKRRNKRPGHQTRDEPSQPEDAMLQFNTTFSQRDAWSSPALRECRVFLRKLTSSSALSPAEKCDDCTLRVSLSVERRELGISRDVTLDKRRSDRGVKGKRGPSRTSAAPPVPRRPRSSRGVMAARWSDFIIGPAR